jgi:hypothetical protein
MLSDALVVAGCEVRHLMDGGRQEPHRVGPEARAEPDGAIVYDRSEDQQALELGP